MTPNNRRIQLRGGNFLEDLPPSIPRYSFEGQEQFREVIDFERDRFQKAIDTQVQEYHRFKRPGQREQEGHIQQNYSSQGPNQPSNNTLHGASKSPNECILFSIPGPSIQADSLDRFNPIRFGHSSFDLATNLLLARMSTPVHSQVIGEFLMAVETEIKERVGLHSVRRYAAATILGDEGSTGKEVDLGWGPTSAPQGFPDKPTVTVEVAVDNSQELQERAVRWWLDPAKGNANLTVTITVDTRKPLITMHKWQRVNDSEIEMTHKSVMSRADDGWIDVTPGVFTIPFELLFRQQAIHDGTELMIDEEALELLADAVWRVQRF